MLEIIIFDENVDSDLVIVQIDLKDFLVLSYQEFIFLFVLVRF